MKRILSVLMLLGVAASAFAQKDSLVGFYVGNIEGAKGYPFSHSPELCAEVARYGDNYQLKLTAEPLKRADTYGFIKGLKAVDGKIEIKEFSGYRFSGTVTPEGLVLKGKDSRGRELVANLKKTEIVSPTMGMTPPAGAIVLFDGKDMSKWQHSDGNPCCWEIKDGAAVSRPQMINGKRKDGTVFTKEKFGAVRMHLEFKIPAEYDKDETRGNSGVHFGPYEIQIIDSFGSEGNWWQCGAVYRIHAPKSNASLEPECWQTYDIEFTPAKFINGVLTAYPEMTVYQNGIRIQNKEPVFHKTDISQKKQSHTSELIPIGLQDHSHPVSFRNIWVQPM